MIERAFFRPAWERAVADRAFRQAFGAAIPAVESAAARIVDEMGAIFEEGDTLTLVHTDINPSNVLVRDGVPFIIDWAVARYGPCYLDVPHHFPTLALAERYRVALGARGVEIESARFAERHHAAARYVGLRYIWWTLDAWRADRSMARWVWHYLRMILGEQPGR
jgi:thiamine kinase-like enzyme